MMMVAIVDYQDDFVFNKRNDDCFKRFTNKRVVRALGQGAN